MYDRASDLQIRGSRDRLSRAKANVPGGVHSNIRLTERPQPLFFARASGSRIWDVDGNEYIDYVLGQGPALLGHAPTAVVEAVTAQLGRGFIFAAQHDLELEAVELLQQLVPSAEAVRFGVTGNESVQAAIRLARAATGRELLLKFQGHYHGWADNVAFNVSRREGCDPETGMCDPQSESEGVSSSITHDLVVAEWNDAAVLRKAFATYGDRLAAVIMEPIMGNSGVIRPVPGYLEEARALCDAHGAVLIFDEVITGFRVHPGGAQGLFGIRPDLSVFGKAIASGFPVSCVAGRRSLFEGVGDRRVLHAGTFNSHPVGLAAAVSTLTRLTSEKSELYQGLETVGSALMAGIAEVARNESVDLLVQGQPALFSVAFTDKPAIHDHAGFAAADAERLAALVSRLMDTHVRIASRGNLFLSIAHNSRDVTETVEGFSKSLKQMVATPVRA